MKPHELTNDILKEVARKISHRPGATRDAQEIVCHVMGINRITLLINQVEPNPEQVKEIYRITELVGSHYPLEYALGYSVFLDLKIKVTPAVLIPRVDTETLVLTAIEILNEKIEKYSPVRQQPRKLVELGKHKQIRVLDLCTGSGCIALSIKNHYPELEVSASDISEDALGIAYENAHNLKLDINLIHSNLFENIFGCFDLVTCNPPYIPTGEFDALEVEISHEPKIALDGGNDGMHFYRTIASYLSDCLNENGVILFEVEIHNDWTLDTLTNIFSDFQTKIILDLSGKPRVLRVEKN